MSVKGILDPAEKGSSCWKTLEAHIQARILLLQRHLEGGKKEKANVTRGRLRELRNLLADVEGLNTGSPKEYQRKIQRNIEP